jgi:nickel-dependent lactate racemase
MIVTIPYGRSKITAKIPQKNLLQVLSPGLANRIENFAEALKYSLEHPIGCPSLKSFLDGQKNICLICDDNTRATPTKEILEVLFSLFKKWNIPLDKVTIVIALGSHRKMSKYEIMEKFGKINIKIHNHDEHTGLVDLGYIDKIPVTVNRLVYKADVKIGIGSIVPHNLVGYGGGGKIILPGICGKPTTDYLHSLYALDLSTDVDKVENPLRKTIETVAEKVGLDFIINTVTNYDDSIAGIFCGDFRKAFRAGIPLARKIYGIKAKDKADIVISSSYPSDIEFYQGNKGIFMAERLVRDGGLLILLSPCYEGIARTHPLFKEYIHEDPDKLLAALKKGEIDDPASAAVGIRMGYVKKRINIAMVTEGITKEEVKYLGFNYCENLESALELGFRICGKDAKVSILTHGGKSFPYFI